MDITRVLHLEESDFWRVSWKGRAVQTAPQPQAFNIERCLQAAASDAVQISPSITKEEAFMWIKAFEIEAKSKVSLKEALCSANNEELPRSLPSIDWLRDLADESQLGEMNPVWRILAVAPQILRDFVAPKDIAELFLRPLKWKSRSVRKLVDTGSLNLIARRLFPYWSKGEREDLLHCLEVHYERLPRKESPSGHAILGWLSLFAENPRVQKYLQALPDFHFAENSGFGLRLLCGLSEAAFPFHARRLLRRLLEPEDVLTWLAATEWRHLLFVRDSILRHTDERNAVEMAKILELVEAPENALPMLNLRNSSRAKEVAEDWFVKYPVVAWTGLVPLAMEKRGQPLGEQALLQLKEMASKSDLAAGKLGAHLSEEQQAWVREQSLRATTREVPECRHVDLPERLRLELDRVESVLSLPLWLDFEKLPRIKIGERALDLMDVQRLIATLKKSPVDKPLKPLILHLKSSASAQSLDQFAALVLEQWCEAGASDDEKWPLSAVTFFGGDLSVQKLAQSIKSWPKLKKQRLASLGLRCLGQIGSDAALMAVCGISQKTKYRTLRTRAESLIAEIGNARNLTPDQLADRVIPRCDLDENGQRIFDYGPRQFTFFLDAGLKAHLRDLSGQTFSQPPPRARDDDPAKAREASQEWRLFRKTVGEVVQVQSTRMEYAMVDRRKWSGADFKECFLGHPLMRVLVRKCLFVKAKSELQFFRVTDENTIENENESALALKDAELIQLAHPLQMSSQLRQTWSALLNDYDIIPLFPQIGRDLHLPRAEELKKTIVNRYSQKVEGGILFGILEGQKWRRSVIEQRLCQHYRYFPAADTTALVSYTGFDFGDKFKAVQRVEAVQFFEGKWVVELPDEYRKYMKIGEVDSIVFSESLRVVEAIVKYAM